MPEPLTFQVTFDAHDPHAQARFWAQVLHYEVEDKHDFVTALLDQGVVTEDDVVEVDGRRGFKVGAGIRPPGADDGEARRNQRLLFMAVPEPRTTKNRVHLDVNVSDAGDDDPWVRIDAEVARVVALGATELYRHDEVDGRWVTLSDPEGNELCLH